MTRNPASSLVWIVTSARATMSMSGRAQRMGVDTDLVPARP